jgi:chromosome segregation ATPase
LSLEDLAPRIQNLRHRQDQLEAAKQDIEDALDNRKAELADLSTVVKYVEDLRATLMDSPLTGTQGFCAELCKGNKGYW